MQEQISDNVVRKIQLLLQLAARTEGNEVEAAAAMARAQEMLARYNLDLSTIQDKVVAGGTNTPEDAMARRDYAKISRSAMYAWQRRLVQAVAEANYCRYWTSDETDEVKITPSRRRWEGEETRVRNVKRHKILGRTANTLTVLLMVDYLMDTIERLLPYPQSERLSRSANSWREGCTDRLIQRIQAKAASMRKADYASQGEAGYSTALALANVAQAEEAGNYDFLYGEGAWARRQQREAEYAANAARWAAERAEREAKELAELEAKLLAETPEQKARRVKAEARQAEADRRYAARYWEREANRARRERQRRDGDAYAAGSRTAEKIGLDAQIGSGRTVHALERP